MWAYVVRRVLYSIPVYLGILLFVMVALRVNDPVYAYLSKNATQAQIDAFTRDAGLDRPFYEQYVLFVSSVVRLDFSNESWGQPGRTVGTLLKDAIVPSLMLTVPALILTSIISICVGMVSAYFRGRMVDRSMMFLAVLGMSVSFLVYIILGQYFNQAMLHNRLGIEWFAIQGYEPGIRNWSHFCLLPVLISVVVAMGYDTRFYRAAMVEETGKDYIVTARAKGAPQSKVMFVHMLKNAMIPIITRIMITLPLLITGSILLERYFGIPGMGFRLIAAIEEKDFPVVQAFTAVFAALFILTNILTDVLYGVVDPRVRLK